MLVCTTILMHSMQKICGYYGQWLRKNQNNGDCGCGWIQLYNCFLFITHWLNLTFKKNLNEKWCSFQKFRLIQSGCLSDWGSSQAFENNASNFLSFWIGKCFICEPIYPWHFLTKSNRAVLKAIFRTKGNSEQRSNYLCKHYLQKKIGSYSSNKITRTWIQITH